MNAKFLMDLIGGVNWARVGLGVVVGLALYFAAHYVWIGRPNEFYTRGFDAATAAEKFACAEQERLKNEEIFKRSESEQKRRAKILARPHATPDRLLERMRSGKI